MARKEPKTRGDKKREKKQSTKKSAKRKARRKSAPIPNQVFLAVPWKNIKQKYEKAVKRLQKKYPLSFIIIGNDEIQDAEDLFEVIKEKLVHSSYAIFDATGGNANVSLEYGLAEANDIQRALYLSTHKGSLKRSADTPIIADLAGKRRNHYKQQNSLSKLLHKFSRSHSYTIRFERFVKDSCRKKSRGQQKRFRTLGLKIIHMLDGVDRVRRADIVQKMQADNSRYNEKEINEIIKLLHRANLIQSQQGPHSRVRIK